MSVDDVPTQRLDGCSPEYVAAVEEALVTVAEPRAMTAADALAAEVEWERALAHPRPVVRGPAPRARVWAAVARGVRSGLAYASVLAVGVLAAAVLVDWWAPTAGPSVCRDVALPLVLAVAFLAVLGLVGAAVHEAGSRRRRSP